MAGIVIRSATADDLAAMVAIDVVVLRDASRATEIAGWLAAATCYCAMLDDAVVGYAVLQRHFFHRPFLEMLMVADGFRQRGVGTALVAHAIDWCAPELLWTSTNESNRPMQSLLDSLGFIRTGIIEGLDEGDPELIYRHQGATPS